jgi:FkbM family methyltransferase
MRCLIKELILRSIPHRPVLVLKQLEVVLRCYFLRRYYEKDGQVFFDIVSKQGDGIAIDVGANLGQFSFPLARLANCMKVIAIEPQPVVCGLFRKITSILRISKIVHVDTLVSDSSGFAYMKMPKRSGYSLSQETFMVHDQKEADTNKIPVITIDDLVANYRVRPESVIAIKIDVEGAELNVLKGAENVISIARPVIMAELIDKFLRRFGNSLRESIGWLRLYGYEVYLFNGECLVKFIEGNSRVSPSGNYFFIPNERIVERHVA